MFDKVFKSTFSGTNRNYQGGSLFDGVFSFGSGGVGAKTSPSSYKNSLKLSAVYNAVDQISNDLAKIPFFVYYKQDGNSVKDKSHYVHKLLNDRPNAHMTPFTWKKTMWTSALLRGNGLSVIKTDSRGIPVELVFVKWDDVTDVKKNGAEVLYYIKGYSKPLLASEVIHIKLFSLNGLVGISVISYAAQQMNIALELQDYTQTVLENKGARQGYITTDKTLQSKSGEESPKKKVVAGWRNAMAEKSPDRVAVLDEGMQFHSIAITPQEAQIVELNQVTIEDIARWFNIALHKIKSLKQSTNNNIEQQSLDHVSDTIQPHCTNFEQELQFKLFTDADKVKEYFIRGNLNVLVRADMRTRIEYIGKAVYYGLMNRNEGRALEEMNAGPTLLDEYLTPTNTYTEKQLEANIKKQGNGKNSA
jgi:HK97 family phage portal protein